jgi:hypothetical protein
VEIQAKGEAFNLSVQQYKEVSNSSKQEEWNRFCEEYDSRDPAVTSKLWSLAQSMNGYGMGMGTGPQQITGPDGERLTTDAEKRASLSTKVH